MSVDHTSTPKRGARVLRALLASLATVGLGAVVITAPFSTESADAEVIPLAPGEVMNQKLMAAATEQAALELPSLRVDKVKEEVATADTAAGDTSAPASPPPDPGSAQAIAQKYVGSGSEYNCLVQLWNRESHWNVSASNASSGAYGIPQALPGSKMASAGSDWRTNADTQIRWGLGYIKGRYGSPCAAWGHSNAVGWY